jgi:hypothetical protein
VAEGGGLLNRYTLQRRIQGSNPCVSASLLIFHNFLRARKLAQRRVASWNAIFAALLLPFCCHFLDFRARVVSIG